MSQGTDDSFKYCGCQIKVTKDNGIELDQNEYIENISHISKKEGDNDRPLDDKEKRDLKSKVGELLWVSLMTRPDLSFQVNFLSSQINEQHTEEAIPN